jgi:short-subunit dehydrogenase
METAFKNKVIITGGSSGIGRATALVSPKKEQNLLWMRHES